MREQQVPRGDGRLTDDLDPQERGPQDACGVFGVWAPEEEVAKLTYFGLFALQHRGQEAAGIAVSDGSGVVVYKDLGLVSQVFDEPTLASLRGYLAIGHTRYSTTGGSNWENAQPTIRATTSGTTIALAHNGNLVNTAELAREVAERGLEATGSSEIGATSDTALVTTLLASRPDLSVEAAALEVLPRLRGAFSFVFMDENTLYAARDAQGVRPLVLGRMERGWVIASETSALDIVGASFVREVEPGEMIAVDEHGLRSSRFAAPEPKGCLFEYVYLARPDTTIAGRNVYSARVEIGRRLAKEHPAEADLVIPVPESGTPAAIGYAEASGIPYSAGLTKNAYVGRTFIQPSQTIRQLGIRLKLNPLREVVRGKRLVVVDDTIANGLEIDGIRRSIGADSLGYVSMDNLVQATEQPKSRLCMACFDGHYPIELPAGNLIGKHLLEGVGKRAASATEAAVAELETDYDAREYSEDAEPLVASPGGSNALHHP
jgi:amidophosphoribosyltransferase